MEAWPSSRDDGLNDGLAMMQAMKSCLDEVNGITFYKTKYKQNPRGFSVGIN